MKPNFILTITSLLSILFVTFHLTDDIFYGMAQAGMKDLIAVAILVIWLYETLALAERRSGTSSSSSDRSLGRPSPSST